MRRIATVGFLAFLIGLATLPARAHEHPGFELKGTIEALHQTSLTLHGLTFHLTAMTRIYSVTGEPIPASQLQIGQRVELSGHFGADGLYYAMKIKLQKPNDSTDEVEAWGPLMALTDSTLTVQGLTFYLSATTQISGQLTVGQQVEVEGIVQSGRFVAVEVTSDRSDEEEDGDHPEIKLQGPITTLGDSTIVVQGHTIRILASTRIRGDADQPLTLADLQVGLFVEVKAQLVNGQLIALVIKIETPEHAEVDRRQVEIEGIILERTDSTFTVGALTFHLTPVTKIEGEDEQSLTPAALQVGVFVEVKGYLDPTTHTLYALKVEIKQLETQQLELVGHIEALGGDSLVVAGITVFVDANTRIEDPWEQPITLADLQIGLPVKVKAHLRDDGTYLALKIKVRKAFHPVVDIEGPIDALTDSTITVSGLVFRVRPGVHVLGPGGQVISLTELQVGQKVRVRGVVRPDGTYWAVRIRAAEQQDDLIEVKGSIEALGSDSLVVAGVTVFVDASTQILAHDGTPITLADLQTGFIVEIEAMLQSGAGLLAQQIKVEDFVGATGQADSVRADAVVLQQATFLITAQTVVVDAQQRPVAWSDVQAGQQVIVYGRRSTQAGKRGVTTAGTTYTADYVTVVGTPSTTDAEIPMLPGTFELAPSYPNPFRQQTTIRFTLSGTMPQPVTLEIYNVLGQRIRTLMQGILTPGQHEVIWDATDDAGRPAASGLYLYRLRVGNRVQTRSMVLMR